MKSLRKRGASAEEKELRGSSPTDGLGPKEIKQIRIAIRRVWGWTHSKKICLKRAVGKDGFSRCEECGKKVPKVFADHIIPVGDVDEGFIKRLFCSSKGLKAICNNCHKLKTNKEREQIRKKKKQREEIPDFF